MQLEEKKRGNLQFSLERGVSEAWELTVRTHRWHAERVRRHERASHLRYQQIRGLQRKIRVGQLRRLPSQSLFVVV
jgi:hypothetical protein